jgi:diadenosine tetraphosphate (Ap4A) HIT family hydrolase
MAECGYCNPVGETVIWSDDRCRVIIAREPGFAGWCRVIWGGHVRELSDLGRADREHLMAVIAALEAVLIATLQPEKMNLAALATAAPHLHFHVIPRFRDDPTFPDPVWVEKKRISDRAVPPDFAATVHTGLVTRLASGV